MAEKIDIYTENFKYIGVEDKKVVHKLGYWHKSFICIVFNPQTKNVYLQKKVPGRYSFDRPDYLDFSVGGHYQAGESIEAGIREIKEELGLDIKFEQLISLGVRKKSARIAKDFIENEFQYFFLLPLQIDLVEIPITGEEVNGWAKISLRKTLKLFKDELKIVDCNVMELKKKKKEFSIQQINLKDFIPSYIKDKLYQRLFIQIDKYINNEALDKWDFDE